MTQLPAIEAQLELVLSAPMDRGQRLRALAELATQPGFGSYAARWAPALYELDAAFFENFLVRNLDALEHQALIEALLQRAETDGHDALFQALYRQVATEERWEAELQKLARSNLDDQAVLRAVRRRIFRGSWFGMHEPTALALYQRNPALFGQFVTSHVRGHAYSRGGATAFRTLRSAMEAHGDAASALAVFRAVANRDVWAYEIQQLIRTFPAAAHIGQMLQDRHPTNVADFDAGVLAELVERYGNAVIPYLEHQQIRYVGGNKQRLFASLRRIGNESAYWRLFLRWSDPTAWNAELRTLLAQPLDAAALADALQLRTQLMQQHRWWELEADVALGIYQRAQSLARPLFEQALRKPLSELWDAAIANDDDEMLDFLAFRALERSQYLGYQAFPNRREQVWRKKNAEAHAELTRITVPVIARFKALIATPERFVRHAAVVLSYIAAYATWDAQRLRQHNPIILLFIDGQQSAWLASPAGMRELIESPNIFVQRLGLELLSTGGPDAAQRTVENLRLLRAMLFGRARINTKKQALRCLELAAQADPQAAAAVLPVLAEAVDVRGKRAVDLRAMVALVRLQHPVREAA